MEYFEHKEMEGKTFICAKDVAKHFGKRNACEFAKYHFRDLKKIGKKLYIEKTQVEEYIDRQTKTEQERSKELEKHFQEMYETRLKNIEEKYQKKFDRLVLEFEEKMLSLIKNYQCHMQISTRFSDITIDHIWFHLRECPCNAQPRFFDEEIKDEIKKIKAIKWYNHHF